MMRNGGGYRTFELFAQAQAEDEIIRHSRNVAHKIFKRWPNLVTAISGDMLAQTACDHITMFRSLPQCGRLKWRAGRTQTLIAFIRRC